MTADADIARALAVLDAWLEAHARDFAGDPQAGDQLQAHLALMRAEAERLRGELEG